MKKKLIKMLVVAFVMLLLHVPTVQVQAVHSWQAAYADLLRQNIGSRFALHDATGNGIPELFISDDDGLFGSLYSYRAGSVHHSEFTSGIGILVPSSTYLQGFFTGSGGSHWSDYFFVTMQEGEWYRQHFMVLERYNGYHRGFEEYGRAISFRVVIYDIENNIVTERSYESFELYGGYGFLVERIDPGFEEVNERTARTRLDFHDITESNITNIIFGDRWGGETNVPMTQQPAQTFASTSSASSASSVLEAYRIALMNHTTERSSWVGSLHGAVIFSLHDIGGDGIPELFAFDGMAFFDEQSNRYVTESYNMTIYTYADGRAIEIYTRNLHMGIGVIAPTDGSSEIIFRDWSMFDRYRKHGNVFERVESGMNINDAFGGPIIPDSDPLPHGYYRLDGNTWQPIGEIEAHRLFGSWDSPGLTRHVATSISGIDPIINAWFIANPLPEPMPNANPVTAQVVVLDLVTNLSAYNIEGSTYVRLRDLAQLLTETTQRFNFIYDGASGVVSLFRGQALNESGEISVPGTEPMFADPSELSILLDGITLDSSTYRINGSLYIAIGIFGNVLGLDISWDDGFTTILAEPLYIEMQEGEQMETSPVPAVAQAGADPPVSNSINLDITQASDPSGGQSPLVSVVITVAAAVAAVATAIGIYLHIERKKRQRLRMARMAKYRNY